MVRNRERPKNVKLRSFDPSFFKNWWDDFGPGDWERVYQKIEFDGLKEDLEMLNGILEGSVARGLNDGREEVGLPKLGILDEEAQELIWSNFFEVLDRVSDFERKVRSYHKRKYGRSGPATYGAKAK